MENRRLLPIAEGDYVQSLDKGLSVLRAFSDERNAMTLSEVARVTGLSKPSARRFLLTLQALGYVESDDGLFRLRPRVLDLGYAYLSSVELPSVVDPFLNDLNAELREACSVGVFDDDSVRTAFSGRPSIGCCFVLGSGIDFVGRQPTPARAVMVDLGFTSTAIVPPPRIFGLRATVRFGGAGG